MKNEPVLTIGTVTGILVALAAILVPNLDAGTLEAAIAAVVPVVAALIARFKVTPV